MVKLLIIDDDEIDRLTIKRALAKTDLEVSVSEAVNIADGIKLIQSENFDCVLLDYRMPGKDGLQVLREIVTGKIKTNIPFIILTEMDDDELALKSLRAGAQDFLTKDGLTPAQLARAITNAIERQELRTQNINIRQELIEQAGFLKTINNTMVDGLVVIDEKGIVLSINKACADIFGYSKEEVVGNNINMLINPYDKKHHDGYIAKHLKTGKSIIIGLGPREVTGRRKDGSAVALELAVNSHEEKDGETIFVASLRDITRRKQTEAAVKEAEDQYKMLADHATDIVILEDTNSRVIYASPSLKRHLGIDPEDAVGKNSWDLVHPEGRKKTYSDWKKIVLGEKKPCTSRLRFQHADGQYIWFESLCSPVVNEAGKVTAVISTNRNISEQIEAEEKLNLVTENMSDIIFLFDTAGKILFVSPSIKNQLGWTIDERLGKTCLDILHAEDKPLWPEWKRGVMEKGNPFTSRVRYRHKDGSYCWFESVTQPIKDKKGRVTAAVMASRNITEQHEAEEKLKMLAENTSDIITLRDSSGKVIYITPSFEKHLGYDPEKERGKNPRLELIHPDDRGKLKLWEKRVYREGKPFLTDLRLKSAKGAYLWFESHTEPIKNKKGEVIAAVTTSRNITEQHEAEEKLKMLADNASDIIMLHGKKGEITYITPALKKHLGTDPKEVIGKQTIGTVHPEDKKDLAKNWNQRVLKEGKSFYRDVRFRNKKGEYLWFECHTQPIKDEKGEVIAAVTSARNITEYKKAESEALSLGRIVEDSLNEIYVFDGKTLKFISVNRGARENLGYSMKELQGMTPFDIKPEYTRKSFSEFIKPLQAGESKRINFETVHKRKDGSEYDVEVYLQLSKTGLKPVFVAIMEDITDKKAASENLRQAQKMEAVGNLSGGIAHDFNNILTAIQGSLQLLEMIETDISDDARECLGIAIKSTKRGADLTHRLLAFSRKQTLKPKVVEVGELIKGMIPMLRRTIDESIEIETRLMEEEALVTVDGSELENSLLNLAVNARDAMPDGGHLIFEVEEVEVKKTKAGEREIEPGRYVVVSVSDSGCGMPPEVRDRVFEPFFTTKGVERGTGLGLSMVYGFVKQSGGHITVYSEVGKGTTFKLYLKATGARKKPRPDKKTTLDLKVKGTGTILLVEDDEGVRQFITQALKAKGYTVLEVDDGPSALLVMEGDKGDSIDLLLTDVVLPKGMSGPEIGKEFEKRYPGKPIIYSSGYTGKAIERNGVLKEGEELLSKPYNLEVLFEWVQASIRKKT